MLRPLYIFTGMDGCGKSTRVSELEKEKSLKYMYEPLDYRFNTLDELKQLYQEHELMDRFFPLDEIVYSKVWDEKPLFTKEQTLELLKEISQERKVFINIGINTYMEYTWVHQIRGEKNVPDYYRSLEGWYEIVKYLTSNIKSLNESQFVDINIFWYHKQLDFEEFTKFVENEMKGRK